MSVRVDGFAWVGVRWMGLCMHIDTCTFPSRVCVWVGGGGGGGGGGGDFLTRAERERVSEFVEIVTFPCMYVSIVRYGLVCIGEHCNSLFLL